MRPFQSRGDFHAWLELQAVLGSLSVLIAGRLFWYDDADRRLFPIYQERAA